MRNRNFLSPRDLFLAYCAIAVASVVVGCGGGGSSTMAAPKVVTAQFGPLATASTGTAQPPVVSVGSGATVMGIAGTQFNDITITSGPSTDVTQTKVAFTTYDSHGNAQICTVPVGGGKPTFLTTQGGVNPSWSHDGSKIIYENLASGTQVSQIFSISADGTGQPVQLTSGGVNKHRPFLSPDGRTLFYESSVDGSTVHQQVFALTNGTVTPVTTTDYNILGYCVSPDGTLVCFPAEGGTSQNSIQLFVTPATGGTPVQITSMTFSCQTPNWSPDGSRICFASQTAAGAPAIFAVSPAGDTPIQISNQGLPQQTYYPSWTADGTHIVFQGVGSTESASLYVMNANSGLFVPLSAGSGSSFAPAASPYLPTYPKKLIGQNGVMGTSAAGCIISQTGNVIDSILTFDTGHATTASRNAARVTTQTGISAQAPSNLIFTVTANDSLSSLKFTTGTSASSITTVIGAGGSVSSSTSAVVSFDGKTGVVALVMTYNNLRAPVVLAQSGGDEVTYQGAITSLVDGQGKNIAPSGVTSVTINSKTGQLVRFK